MKVLVRFALALILVAAASGVVQAQEFEATKFPISGVQLNPVSGGFVAAPGAVVRWRVVLTNPLPPPPIGSDAVVDFIDIVGGDSCGGGMLDCSSADMLQIVCPADPGDPNFPDGADGAVTCDDMNNRLSMEGITVPAGGATCIEFSTLIDPMAGGMVGNAGCVNIQSPVMQSAPTSPPDASAPGWPWDCVNRPTPAVVPGCTQIQILNLPDFEFEMLKTVAHDDANSNRRVDVGETMTWTVQMNDTSSDMMDATGYLFDDIQPDQDFGEILTDPGACAYDMARGRIACDPLTFTDGESKTLVFTTIVNCDALTETDTNQICNQAQICGDEMGLSCVDSDDDGMFATVPDPTCLPFPQVEFTTSEKSYTWTDNDGDGALTDGDTVQFNITVTNTGSLDATDVTVMDDLNPNLDPVNGCMDERTLMVGDGGSFDGGTGLATWTVASLAAGESATVSFTVDIIENAPCCNQAFVNSAERTAECPDAPGIPTDDPATMPEDDEACLTFGPQPNLVVEKDFTEADMDGVVMPGEEITFTVTIRNEGAGAATGVSMSDPVFACFSNCGTVVIDGDGTDESVGPGMGTACTVNVTDIGGPDGMLPDEQVVITWTVVADTGTCCNRAAVDFAEGGTIGSFDPVTGTDQTCMDRAETDCGNGMDDDGDGLADCDDADCADDPLCSGAENCTNGVDDDGDGAVDCVMGNEDSDCPCGPESLADRNCEDGVDNDGDGLTDGDDPDCAMEDCTNGIDDDGDGAIDCETGNEDSDCPCGDESTAAGNCDDGVDNDGDGLTDGDDPDCAAAEDCANRIDDDGDGLIDCQPGMEDPDCPCGPESLADMNCDDGVDNDGDGLPDMEDPDCLEEDCTNGVDDDGDGLADCEMGMEDPDCPCGEESDAQGNCSDGVDNDGDRLTDGDDPDCSGAVEGDCSNGVDDDGDGAADCQDSDCVEDPVCAGEDFDMDGTANGEDCAPTDENVWGLPQVVTGLDFGIDPATGGVLLTWDCQAAEAGPGTVYDVVWGTLEDLIAAGGSAEDAVCADDPATMGTDGNDVVDESMDCRPSFLDIERPGSLYYLVRAQNSCGTGSYGEDSRGNERMVGAGDCP